MWCRHSLPWPQLSIGALLNYCLSLNIEKLIHAYNCSLYLLLFFVRLELPKKVYNIGVLWILKASTFPEYASPAVGYARPSQSVGDVTLCRYHNTTCAINPTHFTEVPSCFFCTLLALLFVPSPKLSPVSRGAICFTLTCVSCSPRHETVPKYAL